MIKLLKMLLLKIDIEISWYWMCCYCKKLLWKTLILITLVLQHINNSASVLLFSPHWVNSNTLHPSLIVFPTLNIFPFRVFLLQIFFENTSLPQIYYFSEYLLLSSSLSGYLYCKQLFHQKIHPGHILLWGIHFL